MTFPESAAHAAMATRWVFEKLVPLSRRITRVYLYQWNAAKGENWDSGLVNATRQVAPGAGGRQGRAEDAAAARGAAGAGAGAAAG